MTNTPSKGRRVATQQAVRKGGVPPTLVVALVAILASAGALAIQQPTEDPEQRAVVAPATRPLTSLSILCPAAVQGSPDLVIGQGTEGGTADDGTLVSRAAEGEKSEDLDLAPGGAGPVDASRDAVVVTGTGTRAPGLFGARFGGPGRPAAGQCAEPSGERWFVGVGAAGGLHESKLLLANPDTGPAVADLSLWSTTGELIDVASRGLTVPGHGSTVIDLAELAPNRDELAVQVTVSRGRVAASVSDDYTPLEGDPVSEWLPPTAAPATTQLVPGLPRTMDEPKLVLANPGADAGRVTLQVVGERSTFTPSGLKEISVGSGEVVVADLPPKLVKQLAEENASLRITSTVPVSGSLRAVVSGDLVHLPAVEELTGDSATALPGGAGSVLTLTPTDKAGQARVEFPGQDRDPETVRLTPGTTTTVPIPAKARAVVVRGTTAYVGSVRTITPKGASVLPLQALDVEQLIPDVRPEWP
ncbi:DUF5719 family protein [Nocardioides sp. Soil796]|uniref:DUF5719 family protein n=1 Tax=Nocardioides sp. Soil796 TaxID=1736412 RepID=UPI00071022AA|nr:DUF5719 family protein [Nocardioides sp. Soil796]KRF14310.1 hypothetical protein ASH02_08135 [Nocardioides sp. Soil796]